jgi:diacylglycerol kinase family enzyme
VVRLIVNPNASRVTPELVAAVERELGGAGAVETVLTRGRGHATELAAEAEPGAALYVLSGDGGFNEVVNGVPEGVPVGFLPGGGTSVLPRALGLPRDAVAAARALAGGEVVRTIALGRVEASLDGDPVVDRRFTFSAGVGLDAELVRAVDRLGRRSGGRRPGDVAFARELGRLLLARRARFGPALTVVGRGRAAFALVANCDPYSYAGRIPLHAAPEATFEGGLDLVAPVELRAARLPAAAAALVRPRPRRPRWLLRVHDADELRIECDAPLPLQVDGEDLGDVTAATFRAERAALDVLVGR